VFVNVRRADDYRCDPCGCKRGAGVMRGRFGIGVMFSSIYDDNRESLELFIFKHLAYRMHASQDAETGPADGR